MKNLKKLIQLTLVLIVLTISACSSDSEPNPTTGPINSGEMKLFVIDTAKVNTISVAGMNETTILNRYVNSNSYISDLELNNDASKFVYADNQYANGTATKSIRVANSNGSIDAAVFTSTTNALTLGFVKYGANKIYFTTIDQTNFPGVAKLNSVNFDGTNLVAENYNPDPLSAYNADLTSDGKYLSLLLESATGSVVQIIDRTLDGGAGGVYFSEALPNSTIKSSYPVFSYDNKFAYFAFVESQTLKVRVVNMTTKTAETKTISTNFTPTSFFITMSIGSDKNRGVVVVSTYDNAPSKSYVFNLQNSSSTSFNNNDDTIFFLKAF